MFPYHHAESEGIQSCLRSALGPPLARGRRTIMALTVPLARRRRDLSLIDVWMTSVPNETPLTVADAMENQRKLSSAAPSYRCSKKTFIPASRHVVTTSKQMEDIEHL